MMVCLGLCLCVSVYICACVCVRICPFSVCVSCGVPACHLTRRSVVVWRRPSHAVLFPVHTQEKLQRTHSPTMAWRGLVTLPLTVANRLVACESGEGGGESNSDA